VTFQWRGITAGRAAELVGGELLGDPLTPIAGIAPLDRAGPGDCSLLASSRFLTAYGRTGAGVVLVDPRFADAPSSCAVRILVKDPLAALGTVTHEINPPPPSIWGIDPTARLGRGVRWTGRLYVGPHAVLGEGVTLGDACVIGRGSLIGDRATMGSGCLIEAHATVAAGSVLGARVIVRSGARVGGEGFAFAAHPDRPPERLPHFGGCRLGDDVEVGSNATVDRGRLGDTVLGPGTKLDAQVHIAHNVRVGSGCLIMAQVGVAGSSMLGDRVTVAGQAGITDHVRIGAEARIAAQAGIIGDVAPGATVSGYPARSHRQVLRQTAALRRLEPLVAHLERLVGHAAD